MGTMTEAPSHLDSVSTETKLGRRPGRPNDKMKARILSLYDEHWSRATRERFWHAHKALVMLEDLGWLTGDQERAVRLSSFRDGERGTLNVSKLQRLAMAELLASTPRLPGMKAGLRNEPTTSSSH